MYTIFPWVFTVLYIQGIQIFKQIRMIYTSNVHTFPLNFHYFVETDSNVEIDFINAEKQNRLLWNLDMKSIQIWLLNLENTISLGVLLENSEQFFK